MNAAALSPKAATAHAAAPIAHKKKSKALWWLIGGGLVLVVAVLVAMKMKNANAGKGVEHRRELAPGRPGTLPHCPLGSLGQRLGRQHAEADRGARSQRGLSDALRDFVRDMLETFGTKNYIANLGHGILPNVPVEHAKAFVDTVKNYRY